MLLIMVSAGALGLVLCHDVLFTWPVREIAAWVRCRLDSRRGRPIQGLRPGDGFMVPAVPSSAGPGAGGFARPAGSRRPSPARPIG